YTPDPHYLGADSFDFQATDGLATTAVTTVHLYVYDTVPTVTTPLTFNSVPHDRPYTDSLGASDSNGDVLHYTVETAPQHGTVSFPTMYYWWQPQTFVYTPNPGYRGPDSFTYRVSDGFPSAPLGTVSLWVVNWAPTAQTPQAF